MTDCAAPRHDSQAEPTPARHPGYLCLPCERGLGRDLRRLPRLHAELDHVPARGDGDGSGLPFSEPASECRDQIRHDLLYWARHVIDVRHAALPSAAGWNADEVFVLAGWLAGQVTWCSFRDWVPDMAGAIAADRSRAMALLDPWVTKRFPLPDRCPDCGPGILEVTIYASDGDRRKSFIGCLECGAQWDFGGDWLPFLALLKRLRKVSADMEVVVS